MWSGGNLLMFKKYVLPLYIRVEEQTKDGKAKNALHNLLF
jgi:hypothetical protein